MATCNRQKHQNYSSMNRIEGSLSALEKPKGWPSRGGNLLLEVLRNPVYFFHRPHPTAKSWEDAVFTPGSHIPTVLGENGWRSWKWGFSTTTKFYQTMKGMRLCHPKICHFSIKMTLSWMQVRKSRQRESFPPSPNPPKSINFPCKGIPLSWTWERTL